ncbi:MAG: HAD family hydrolase [Deltaproteobacteria bacterium]|nr:MAG: HAD family hydrolase [Deltaproteobacteria bacterium]
MPIDTFLFDLDGTLVDSIPDLTKAVNLLRSELDLPTVTSDEVRSYVGDGVGLLLQRALPEGQFSTARRKRFMEIYTEHLTDETLIYPGITAFLEMHHDKKMAVVTNKPQHLADIIVDRLGLAPFFQAVIGAELALQRKPHPEMLHHAMNLLGCMPEHTVMFGDHHVDLRAAHAAGVKTCFCAWGLGHDDGLQADFQAITTADLPRLFPAGGHP